VQVEKIIGGVIVASMPELPEVESIVSKLRPRLLSRSFKSIAVYRDKSWTGDSSLIVDRSIMSIDRRAKMIVWSFEKTDQVMVTHLKMTGQLIHISQEGKVGGGHPTADWVQDLPSKHTRIEFGIDDGTQLYFNDQRVFGWCRVFNRLQLDQAMINVAPDVIDPRLTVDILQKKLAGRQIPIKQAILDSSIMAGVGNIYACDGLHLAKISPFRSANSLSRSEISRLLESLQTVILLGIEMGGATISDYTNVDGFAGKYQDVIRVYGKEGEPCPSCGQPIARTKQGGRSTFWCQGCQT